AIRALPDLCLGIVSASRVRPLDVSSVDPKAPARPGLFFTAAARNPAQSRERAKKTAACSRALPRPSPWRRTRGHPTRPSVTDYPGTVAARSELNSSEA